MLLKDFRGVVGPLTLTHRFKTCPLCGEVKAADPGE